MNTFVRQIFQLSLLLSATLLPPALCAQGPEAGLAAGFASPPDSARPWVCWLWLHGNVTREGITHNLEEMKRKGIGGAMILAAGNTPPGLRFMGEKWREMFAHAVSEANRLGLELSMNIGNWPSGGGQWITPELAAQRVVFSATEVEGIKQFSARLPISESVRTDKAGRVVFYRDIAILAVKKPKLPERPNRDVLPKITVSSSHKDHPLALATDGYLQTYWSSKGARPGDGPSAAFPEWILFEFDEPFSIRSFYIAPAPGRGPERCKLQWSEDGETFKTLQQFVLPPGRPQTLWFPIFSSRIYRLLINSAYDKGSRQKSRNVQIREIALLQEGETHKVVPVPEPIKNLELKSVDKLLDSGNVDLDPYFEQAVSVPGEVQAQLDTTVNLTGKMGKDGSLTWNVPKGHWTIFRFGYTTTDQEVSGCNDGAAGLVLDRLSAEATDRQFQATAEMLVSNKTGEPRGLSPRKALPQDKPGGSPADLSGALKYFNSADCRFGPTNWTPDFQAEFQRRCGYDITPYLPVLAGKIVQQRDISNRFLYDFRRTIGESIAQNHYGRLSDLSHRYGVGYNSTFGGSQPPPVDVLKCLGRSDIPMGEFSATLQTAGKDHRRSSVKQAASAAHIYGKNLVAAEGFTTLGSHRENEPRELKPAADRAFCEGVNRIFMRTFTSSPPEADSQGCEYFAGVHFNPNVTWWEQADAWTDYLARCQFMLMQGRFVADVCRYYGGGVPGVVPPEYVDPDLGPGYDYDVVDDEVILSKMSVRNGRIVLPGGMSYQLLVLPDRRAIELDVLQKIAELVEAGATVVGPRPTATPGLRNWPNCDKEVQKLSRRLWGPCDGKIITEHRCGKGRIVWGEKPRNILKSMGVRPDFVYRSALEDTRLDYIHRSCGDVEIYFVANRRDRWEETDCTFRVAGKAPEVWLPDSGRRVALAVYDFDLVNGGTRIPLRLAPYGSAFVVFRTVPERVRLFSLRRNGRPLFPISKGKVSVLPYIEVLPSKLSNDAFEVRLWVPGRYQL